MDWRWRDWGRRLVKNDGDRPTRFGVQFTHVVTNPLEQKGGEDG